jgi:hypothetical protein
MTPPLAGLQPTPPPLVKLAAQLPKSNALRFLMIYGAGPRYSRQTIQRALLTTEPPRRFDEQWEAM